MGNFVSDEYCIRSFDGSKIGVIGTTTAKINFGPFSKSGQLSVVTGLNYDVIIGLDLMFKCVIERSQKSGRINKIEVNDHPLKISNEALDQYLCCATKITIEPKSQLSITFESPGINKSDLFTLVPHPNRPNLIEVLSTVCYGNKLIGVLENKSEGSVTLPKHVPLYEIVREDKNINNLMVIEDEKSETERHLNFLNERKNKFNSHKVVPNIEFGESIKNDEAKKADINEILLKNNLVFSSDKMDIGLIRGFRYKVDLKEGAEAWYQPARRIPPAVKDELTEQFGNELENNLLVPGNSQYNIPLVIIKKKDGRFRCCLDMRQGNSRINSSKYPLPDLHSILTEIGEMIMTANGEKIYIASFDMNSAYRQLAIKDEDIQKFAFTFHNSKYPHQLANTRMVFGAEDAPSTFSMLMRTVLSGLKGTWNYLDDIQVCAVGFENLKTQISALFERLLEYGITLDQKKCVIGVEQTQLLGHIISANGISLMPEKVEAIKNLPSPLNRDQVRSVCGSFAYFIDFVPHLMETISPLYDLLKRNTNFKWSNIHQQALAKAKKDLADCTIRNHRNLKLKLVIVSDASDVGCGAYLGQINESGKIEPLQFYSKIFSDAEKRKPIRMRELYAIFYAIKKWQSILIAEEFLVLTDHKSLEFLMNTKSNELGVRLFNLLYYLGHFQFKIVHISGTDPRMCTSDMLSRAEYFKSSQDREEENSEFEDPTHVFSKKVNNIQIYEFLNTDTLAEAQKNDEFCQKRVKKVGYEIEDGLLFKKDKTQNLLILTEIVAKEIVEYCHRCKGHMGPKRLYDYLKTTFYSQNLSKTCQEVTANCRDCISVKFRKPKKGPKPEILDIETVPFTKVYFDLIDFGGESDNGFRYGVSYQCALTRFLDIEPIKDKTNVSVSGALLKLFLRYGIPDRAVCDNGKEVIGETNKILYNMLGIYVSNISPLRPQGNLVERCHKEIGNLLKIYNISLDKWDVYLPLVVFYYNTNGTDVLNGLTPFEALYLRPQKSPLSFNTKDKLKRDWTENFGNYAEKIFTDLAKNHKARFNAQNVIKNEVPETLKKNQRVLILKPQTKGKSQKLYRKWDGPYVVVKKTSSCVYLLCHIITGRRCKRNIDLIRVIPVEKANIEPRNLPQLAQSQVAEPPSENVAVASPSPDDHNENLPEEQTENILEQNLQTRTRRPPRHLRDYIL